MSDYSSYSGSALTQGIGDLSEAHKALTDHLETLEGQLNGSLAQWDGDARAAYAAAKAEWDRAANHMGQVIAKMSSTMGQIQEGYDGNERSIQNTWS